MGSAAAAHLAARGSRVFGLERFGPAHDCNSGHGGADIRQSYFEDPAAGAKPSRTMASTMWPTSTDPRVVTRPGSRDTAAGQFVVEHDRYVDP